MSENEKQICRLCFNEVGVKGQVIDEIIREMLNVLLLNLDFNIVNNPIVCQNCAAIVQRSFCFKSTCVHIEKLIFSVAIDREQTKLELKDVIYDNEDTEVFTEEVIICRFCMNQSEKSNFTSMDVLVQNKLNTKMLAAFLPEMDYHIVKNSAICTFCRENLGCYFKLIKNCFDVEEKLNIYYQDENINNTGRVQLSKVPQALLKTNLKCMKVHSYEVRNILKKNEDICVEDVTKIEEILDIKEDVLTENSLRHSPYMILDEYEASEVVKCHKKASKPSMYKCTKCGYETKYKYSMKQHTLTHKDVSQVDMYKCVYCKFETKRKDSIKRHTMLIHEGNSEISMYECSICNWTTKYKTSLKQHALMHKDAAELEIYKCSVCSYQTKYKHYMKYHALVHKDASEVEMYKCKMCHYETRHKYRLKEHYVTHKDVAKGEMYKCALCPYAGKQKTNLKKHMLMHKDPSELLMHRCSMCNYEAKKKGTLQRHMLVHKDPSEVETYKCSLCTYKTKHKRGIGRHMLTHKDASEVKMYKCSACAFQTKYKCSYKTHFNMTHQEKSRIDAC